MMTFSLKPDPLAHARAVSDIAKLLYLFDLSTGNLADEVAAGAAAGIMWNMMQECDPHGIPWPALNPHYEFWKSGIAPGQPIGVLFGVMRQIDELIGTSTVSTDEIVQSFGITTLAQVEAYQFQEGGIVNGTRQPPRFFYGFSATATQNVDQCFDRRFASFTVTP